MFLVFFILLLRKRIHFISFKQVLSLTIYSCDIMLIYLHVPVPKGILGILSLIYSEFWNRDYLILMPPDILWRVPSWGKKKEIKTFSKLLNTSMK